MMRKFKPGTHVICMFDNAEIMAKIVYINTDDNKAYVELESNEFNIQYTKVDLKKLRHTDEMDELTSDDYLDLMILARSLKCTDMYYSYRNKLNKSAII